MGKKWKPRFWDKPQMKQKPIQESRTLEQIRNEYSTTCAVLGEKQFKAHALEAEMSGLYARLRQLVQENDELVKKEAEKKKQEELASAITSEVKESASNG